MPAARRNAQKPAQLAALAHALLGLVDSREHLLHAQQEPGSGARGHDGPGSAREQPGAEAGFQLGDRPGGLRLRQAALARRSREAAERRDARVEAEREDVPHPSTLNCNEVPGQIDVPRT